MDEDLKIEKDTMSEESFKEVIDNIEIIEHLTLYARKNIKCYFNKLLQENKQQTDIIKNSISKYKVKAKIEELQEEKYILSSRDAEIKLLQELLEGDE